MKLCNLSNLFLVIKTKSLYSLNALIWKREVLSTESWTATNWNISWILRKLTLKCSQSRGIFILCLLVRTRVRKRKYVVASGVSQCPEVIQSTLLHLHIISMQLRKFPLLIRTTFFVVKNVEWQGNRSCQLHAKTIILFISFVCLLIYSKRC